MNIRSSDVGIWNNLRIFIVESRVNSFVIQIKSGRSFSSDKAMSLHFLRKVLMDLTGHSFSLLGKLGILIGFVQNEWEWFFLV